MSTEQDIIQIILEVKDDEAQQAKRTLEQLADAGRQLKADLDATRITNDQYRAGLGKLATDAEQARAKLSGLKDEMRSLARQSGGSGPKLEGAERAGAKARLGLAGANIAQDVIQGGPASAINNLLGLAGDSKIRSLASEFVEAAGGASGLISKLTIIGTAAAAGLGVLSAGLKEAKLEWSDLDEVAANSGPIRAVKETLEGIGEAAKGLYLVEAFNGAYDAAAGYIHAVAEATLGWDEATAAAKAHKEEVARGVQAARDYAAAAKNLASFRSDEQEERAKRGKMVGGELADLGKEGGIDAVIDRLAKQATAKGGDDKVDWYKLDEKGQPTGDPEQITRREKARRELASDFSKATTGDTAALDRIRPQLQRAGYDLEGLNGAAQGRDIKKEKTDQIDADEQAAWDDLQESIRSVKEWSADFKHQVQEATRSRSFLDKADLDLTGAEQEAKKLHDDFETKVKQSLRSFSFMDPGRQIKEDENMTPEQQEAARRYRRTAAQFHSGTMQQQTPQVFHDYRSIIDQIQTSGRLADNGPHLVDITRELKEQTPLLKKISEQRFVQGPARFG